MQVRDDPPLAYTICFIRQGDRILLLNRDRPEWMGCWNGVGGKLEPGEAPEASILREIREETGLEPECVVSGGTVTWSVDGRPVGGMYLFLADLPEDMVYATPRATDEGILDWKSADWILHPDNRGVAANLPYFLPLLLEGRYRYEHRCIFERDRLVDVRSTALETEGKSEVQSWKNG